MQEEMIQEEMLQDEDVMSTEKGKYMTFKSNGEYFGIALKYVVEIVGIQKITAIPEVEDYIKGLINLRGKIIPVIDVRVRFKQEPFEYNDRTCIIIINVNDTVVGLIVETIAEVVEINDSNIVPPPTLNPKNVKNQYVYGLGKVGESVKMLLDPNKLIKDEELSFLEDVASQTEEDAEGMTEESEE